YDNLYRRTKVAFEPDVYTPGPDEYTYRFDGSDSLSSHVAPSAITTTIDADDSGRPTAIDCPTDGRTSYDAYDQVGNVSAVTDARSTVSTYTYDNANRVTLRHYPGSPSEDVVYRYDEAFAGNGKGRLTTIEGGGPVRIRYAYDRRGNVVNEWREGPGTLAV